MIFGDLLLLTKQGIQINSKALETVGIFEGSKAHILPLKTFEHRKNEQGFKNPLDLLITPIHPKVWPFVLRFEIRIYNNAKALEKAFEFFYKTGINILFSESTRSGHHHIVLNVLGTMKRIEGKSINDIFIDLKKSENKLKNAIWHQAIDKFVGQGKENEKNSTNQNNEEKEKQYKNFNEFYNSEFEEGNKKPTKEDLAKILGKFYYRLYGNNSKSSADSSIQNILYQEIVRLRPVIRELKDLYKDKPEELYRVVEKEIIPIKELLNFVLYYKQKIIEKLEILMLKDALILPERDIEEYDFTKIKEYSRKKEDVYIYNIKHYYSLLTFSSYFKEWFLSDTDLKRFEVVSNVIELINNLLKLTDNNKDKDKNNNVATINENIKILIKDGCLSDKGSKLLEAIKKNINNNNTKKREDEINKIKEKIEGLKKITPYEIIDLLIDFSGNSNDYEKLIELILLTAGINENDNINDLKNKIKDILNNSKLSKEDLKNKIKDILNNSKFSEEDLKNKIKDILNNSKFSKEDLKNKIKDILNNSKFSKEDLKNKIKDILNNSKFSEEDLKNKIKDILNNFKFSKEDLKNSIKDQLNKYFKEKYKKNKDIDWDILLHMIFQQIKQLQSGRKTIQIHESRIDLDPIIITPVESLNHAYYHLAYYSDFTTFVEKNNIPFPQKNAIYYPKEVFEKWFVKSKTTVAIASRNTNDLTLRLSPVPQKNNNEYFTITLKSFRRSCYKECSKNGLEIFGKEEYYEIKEVCDISKICSEKKSEETNNKNNKEIKNKKKCKGTSRGLVLAMTKAINKVCGNNLFISRVFTKKKFNMSRDEQGSITYLINYEGDKSIEKLKIEIEKELKCILEKIGVSKHIEEGYIEIEKITVGRIFISIPFNNPMSKTWIKIIKEEASKLGLEAIVAETYTKSASLNIKKLLDISDAMIQIFAKEVPDKNGKTSNYEPSWLHSEFFNSFAEKPIVRLIDTKSVDPNEIIIARDNPYIKFSVTEPESEFRKKVAKSIEYIKEELADSKGFS